MIRSKGISELCFSEAQLRILGRLEHSFPDVSGYTTCESNSLGHG